METSSVGIAVLRGSCCRSMSFSRLTAYARGSPRPPNAARPSDAIAAIGLLRSVPDGSALRVGLAARVLLGATGRRAAIGDPVRGRARRPTPAHRRRLSSRTDSDDRARGSSTPRSPVRSPCVDCSRGFECTGSARCAALRRPIEIHWLLERRTASSTMRRRVAPTEPDSCPLRAAVRSRSELPRSS